ncbi:EAL domain-containing protein [Roseomonas sp. USHLN139]|uniref:EAL domain-containing protein n=1 Tax=Roseomonas sp. USHLN139 TaxID=3081298 RepID=UPI003B010178
MTAQDPLAEAAPLQVLVVDDEPLIQQQIARTLRRRGLVVHTAGSAAEGEALLRDGPAIGAVVSDIRMPGEDGLRFSARLLAEQPEAQRVEVVLITGHASIEAASAAVRSGAFDFLQKPFDVVELQETVARALRRAETRRAAAREVASARAAARPEGGAAPGGAAVLAARLAALPPGLPVALIKTELFRMDQLARQLGQPAAEAILAKVAQWLRDRAGPQDTVVRLGPYRLGWLRAGVEAAALPALVAEWARQLAAPVHYQRAGAMLQAGIGAAHAAAIGEAGLLQAAGAALAGAHGSREPEIFSTARHGRFLHGAALAEEIMEAIGAGQLELHYQPVVDCRQGGLRGFEALLRWRHPERGMVGPGEFLGIAADLNLMEELDRHCIAAGIRQRAAWRDLAPPSLVLNLNVSVGTVSGPGFADFVLAEIDRAGVAPGSLCLEVTESEAHDPRSGDVLAELREAGLKLAIDDFGTGYSSLARLQEIAADSLKLDRSFLRGLASDAAEGALESGLVGRIIALAQAMGLQVVAEGVETAEQLRWLRQLRCDSVQGFFFAPALPGAAAERLLRDGPDWAPLPPL